MSSKLLASSYPFVPVPRGPKTVKLQSLFRSALSGAKKDSTLPDAPWSTTWSGTRRALRHLKTPLDILKAYISDVKTSTSTELSYMLPLLDMPTSVVVPALKTFKTLVLNNCDWISESGWRAALDIETLSGYPKMSDRAMTDDPYAWLTETKTILYDPQWFCSAFSSTYAFYSVPPKKEIISLREFVTSRWLWSTSGATPFSLLKEDDKVVRSKFAAAVSLSDDDLLRMVYGPFDAAGKVWLPGLRTTYDSAIGIFIKPDEKGFKRRLIANVPLGQYILASYIGYILDSYLPPSSPLYHSSVTVDDVQRVTQMIKMNAFTFIPLDESSYDYNFPRNAWLGFIEFMRHTFGNLDFVVLFAEYFSRAEWKDKGRTGPWLSGMPSGLALTSKLNSWVNFIKQRAIAPFSYLNYASGDDALAAYPRGSAPELDVIEAAYGRFGAVVAAHKNWKSARYAEFLKVLFTKHGSTGYPARVFSSLIWKGSDERDTTPFSRMMELCELYKQYYDRLGVPFKTKLVAADISRMVSRKLAGFSTREVIDWLHSPRARGGFGRLPYSNYSFSFDVGEVRNVPFTGGLINLPPRRWNVGSYEWRKSPAVNVGFGSLHIKKRPTLPPVSNMAEWEARLNMEDVPEWVPAKWRSAYLDTVPLPVVDFVSTSVMSQFSDRLRLYTINQVRGTTEATVRRLILASQVVAATVDQFRVRNGLLYLL